MLSGDIQPDTFLGNGLFRMQGQGRCFFHHGDFPAGQMLRQPDQLVFQFLVKIEVDQPGIAFAVPEETRRIRFQLRIEILLVTYRFDRLTRPGLFQQIGVRIHFFRVPEKVKRIASGAFVRLGRIAADQRITERNCFRSVACVGDSFRS